MRVALYARFSSENQRESSITDQFRNCEQYAQREGWEIVERYSDKAISGSTSERPAYQQMLKDAKARLFDILLVDDLSRLTRDEAELIQTRRKLVFWGVRFIGLSDGFDTAQKGHKMLSSFKGIMNEVFLDDLRDKTKRGMEGQILKGYHVGGRVYGYRLEAAYHPTEMDAYGFLRIGTRLAINEAEAEWVRWIFEQYAAGASALKIVTELTRRGIPPPGRHYKRKSPHPAVWASSALFGNIHHGLGLLNNRLYHGEHVWGSCTWRKDPDTGARRRVLCVEQDWIRVPAEHLRIVDEKLWSAVMARQADIHTATVVIQRALHPRARTGSAPKFLFSGLLACGECRRKFVIVDAKNYGCAGRARRAATVCANAIRIPRALMEQRLLQAIAKDLFTEEARALFIKETTRLLTEQRRTQKPDTQAAGARLQDIEREIENLMDAIKQGIITPSTKAALEKAEAERATLLKAAQVPQPTDAKVSTFLPSAVSRLKALVDDLAHVTQPQVDKARAVLRTMLGTQIILHPTADGDTRYLTAEISGDYSGLLRLATGQNKFGSGSPQRIELTKKSASIGRRLCLHHLPLCPNERSPLPAFSSGRK